MPTMRRRLCAEMELMNEQWISVTTADLINRRVEALGLEVDGVAGQTDHPSLVLLHAYAKHKASLTMERAEAGREASGEAAELERRVLAAVETARRDGQNEDVQRELKAVAAEIANIRPQVPESNALRSYWAKAKVEVDRKIELDRQAAQRATQIRVAVRRM